ncbi:MAG: Dyp-type peroxidase [Alphaproteobacteria bacterium]|nr:Dyp-type peroxidase [Alphaproteobacteria bacterium]
MNYSTLQLDLNDIQGDLLTGMQKHAELFLFFKIADAARFKAVVREYVVGLLTHGGTVQERDRIVAARRRRGGSGSGEMPWLGMNLGFTKDGLTRLLGPTRPQMDPAFERGADDPETIAALNDPPPSKWLRSFLADRIDAVFLIAGPDKFFVTSHGNSLRGRLGSAIKTVYSEIGTVRPGRERGHEHFGFLDGISQPGIRGLAPVSRPSAAPEQGLPGQDLIWAGEFVLGYPGQNPRDPIKPGPIEPLPAPWAKNGSYMVFRRLEQRVPEFRAFVAAQAARLGIYSELLAARMVGRWKSGAPLELAPLRDNPALGADENRNNDFEFGDDPFQRKCPYAAHIRKVYPRDDTGNEAEVQRHRIIRASIPFGPEVAPGETTTRHSRGLMFVCYQTSIERQFEFIQRSYSSDPRFVGGKTRPGGGAVTPGFDPIIGQAPSGGPREMDEPYPNYPAGNRRTTLEMPHQFVVLTAAGYFFVPSITALRTALT